MKRWMRWVMVPLALGAMAGCDAGELETKGVGLDPEEEGPGDETPQEVAPVATVTLDAAYTSRCNEMMEFRRVAVTMTVENKTPNELVLADVDVTVDPDLVVGALPVAEDLVIPVGGSVQVHCHDMEAVLAWPESDDFPLTAPLTLDLTLENAEGSVVGGVRVGGAMEFMEAWDSCDTYTGPPSPCYVLPAPDAQP